MDWKVPSRQDCAEVRATAINPTYASAASAISIGATTVDAPTIATAGATAVVTSDTTVVAIDTAATTFTKCAEAISGASTPAST